MKKQFGDNLRLLRKAYQLKATWLARYLFMQYRNYQRYEKNEIDPPLSKVVLLSNLFGVSMDWLIGRQVMPYNKDILFEIEDELIAKFEATDVKQGQWKHSVAYYLNQYPSWEKKNRSRYYSDGVRANIIFLCNCYNYIFESAEKIRLVKLIDELLEVGKYHVNAITGDLEYDIVKTKPLYDLEAMINGDGKD